MYKVIRKFEDKDGHVYDIGDVYPREGAKKPTSARVKILSSDKNSYGQIYIKKVNE